MVKSFITNRPAINMTAVGFGQAGSRIVDVLAKYQTSEGVQTYNCLALNSNSGDLKELKYIAPENRVSLDLGGLGKNPEKAMKILNNDSKVQALMKNFISKKLRPNDDLVLFFAGLGGGTGTSTIVKAIADFHDHYNKPKIRQVLEAMIEKVGVDAYKANESEFHRRALQIAEEKFIKIGVVACLPLRNDGPDVLRQVNTFAQEIWSLANDQAKGIAFVMFPDNQYFYDNFKKRPQTNEGNIDNYRDFANKQIAETIHEINVAANKGGTSIVLDSQDLKRAWTEHKGCLVMSKCELHVDAVKDAVAIADMFKSTFKKSNLHEPLELVRTVDGGQEVAKVHHVGLLAAIDTKKDYGNGAFIERAVEELHEMLPITGTVFNGYISEKNDDLVTVYSFYKADALPARLEKGLVEEYEEYMKRNQSIKFGSANIESINSSDSETDKLSLADIGLDDLFNEEKPVKEKASKDDIAAALKDFDFNFPE